MARTGTERESPLAGLHALERRYDGPFPAGALAALGATAAELDARSAAADGTILDRLARAAVAGLADARRGADADAVAGPAVHEAQAQLTDLRAAALRRRAAAGAAG